MNGESSKTEFSATMKNWQQKERGCGVSEKESEKSTPSLYNIGKSKRQRQEVD